MFSQAEKCGPILALLEWIPLACHGAAKSWPEMIVPVKGEQTI